MALALFSFLFRGLIMATGDALLANSHVYDSESGEWVNARYQRLAEIIQDLNPNLFLVWIPPVMRTDNDLQPYGVMHRQADGSEYMFMTLTEQEIDNDAAVLAQIFESQSDTLETRLQNMEAAKELIRLKEEMERREEMFDKAKSMWNSPKHYYKDENGRVLHL